MTRASLLHILNHVGSISEGEIRELEQLAAAFPYCQTAHVLLAKAAHDQGSMLASQRLRRAATYAADRQLLRQLIEQPAPAPTSVELLAPKELPAPTETSLPSSTSGAGGSTAFFQALVTEDVQLLEPQEEEATTAVEELASDAAEAAAPELPISSAPTLPEAEIETQEASEPAQVVGEQTEGEPEGPDDPDTIGPLVSTEVAEGATATLQGSIDTPPVPPADDATEATDLEPVDSTLSTAEADTNNTPADADSKETPEGVSAFEADSEEVLPAVAPPIRPPVEAGTSRFEFGLSEPNKLPVPILYQLPGLDEEEEAIEETPEEYALFPPATTTALAPAFRADADLAYGLLEGGSRFGYALQLRDEELTLPLPATEFFPPDVLLHAHTVSTSPPRSTPAPSSLDLINRFLKVQPRLKAPGVLPLVSEQTDLAARSTHAPPALASESLAKILVKQGKTDRAIEIYEQLMVRQPEKSAYFADQIQQLKSPE